MGYAVRNDGQGWRVIDAANDCSAGETYSVAQPPFPVPTPAQELASTVAAAMAAGLSITSAGTLAIDGTYPLDDATQHKITAIALFTQINGDFPGGASVYPMPDTAGVMHILPSVAVFDEWSTAIANHVAAIDLYGAGVPGAELPSASVAIA